ncbi:MAG: nuclear transport factor 2 family protein [Erythrobacter sp.]
MSGPGRIRTADELASEAAIRAVLAGYCRAVDRADADLLEACFWGDATVDYGGYKGAAAPFCPLLVEAIRAWGQTHHQLGQTLVEFTGGDAARVETYVTAGHFPAGGQLDEMTYLGRYLDRFERRGDEWRIADRVIVMSWTRVGPVSHDPAGSAVAGLRTAARKPDDPLYE